MRASCNNTAADRRWSPSVTWVTRDESVSHLYQTHNSLGAHSILVYLSSRNVISELFEFHSDQIRVLCDLSCYINLTVVVVAVVVVVVVSD